MKTFVTLVLCSFLAGCAAPAPSAGPPNTPITTPPAASPSSRPSESSGPAIVADALGDISFTRPISWQKIRPTVAMVPGPLLWLSSVPLAPACTSPTATSCLPANGLPDGGALVAFGTGATLVSMAATPLPVRSPRDDACTAAGGHTLSSRIETIWITACLRGSPADADFDAFYASLRINP